MKTDAEWDEEVRFLARQWQPAVEGQVLEFYAQRRKRTRAKLAFVDAYERFFLNPGPEELAP